MGLPKETRAGAGSWLVWPFVSGRSSSRTARRTRFDEEEVPAGLGGAVDRNDSSAPPGGTLIVRVSRL